MHRLIERCDNTHPDASHGNRLLELWATKHKHRKEERTNAADARGASAQFSGLCHSNKTLLLSHLASSGLWMFNKLILHLFNILLVVTSALSFLSHSNIFIFHIWDPTRTEEFQS